MGRVADAAAFEVGVIADTHGLLRPEALAALRGVSLILHAGDIGNPEIIDTLSGLAPVAAIRGNIDYGAWSQAYPYTRTVEAAGARLYLLHDLASLSLDPAASGIAAVISGHSHRPLAERRQGVLYLNPGSAGPRRFSLPVSLARLTIQHGRVEARLITLRVER